MEQQNGNAQANERIYNVYSSFEIFTPAILTTIDKSKKKKKQLDIDFDKVSIK